MGIFKSKPKKKVEPKNKNAELTERDKAMLEIKRSRDRLKKYRNGLDVVISKENVIARELINKKEKQKAVLVLKRKRIQEKMLEKADGQMLNIEQMQLQIQSAVVDKEVYDAMKQGKDMLDALQKECSLDDVEDLMNDIADGHKMQEEISTALGTQFNPAEMTEIEGEVSDLMEELMRENGLEEQAKVPQKAANTDEEKLAQEIAELPTAEPKKQPEEVVESPTADELIVF